MAFKFRHIHLPSSAPNGSYPSYAQAVALQELLRRQFLDHKSSHTISLATSSSSASTSTASQSLPIPTLLSFTPEPTYTLGRRQTPSSSAQLTSEDFARLRAPLHVRESLKFPPTPPASPDLSSTSLSLSSSSSPSSSSPSDNSTTPELLSQSPPPSPPLHKSHTYHPKIFSSPRGGLATYHGPGQVVLWPVFDISGSTPIPTLSSTSISTSLSNSREQRSFSVKCYSRLLEKTTIATIRRLFGIKAFTTDDPGVWVTTPGTEQDPAGETRKLSALGIYLRRYISSLGAAINLEMPTTTTTTTTTTTSTALDPSGSDEPVNPWSRFTACGLEGRAVTCVEAELRALGGTGIPGIEAQVVAGVWAEELVQRIMINKNQADGEKGSPDGVEAQIEAQQEAREVIERVSGQELDNLMIRAERAGYLEAALREEIV